MPIEIAGNDTVAALTSSALRATAECTARLVEFRPGGPMDRPVDPVTTEQGRVRRVDDRVDVLLGDVSQHRFEFHLQLLTDFILVLQFGTE